MATPERTVAGRVWRIGRWVLLCVAAAVIALIVWMAVDMFRGPQIVEHALPRDVPYHVPPDATDVCYVTRPVFWPDAACEFSVSEESFVAWAEARKYDMKEIRGSFSIGRYKASAGKSRADRNAVISDGLCYSRLEPDDPDAGVQVAYDRNLQRGYFFAHSR